jgi:hypothetical protein
VTLSPLEVRCRPGNPASGFSAKGRAGSDCERLQVEKMKHEQQVALWIYQNNLLWSRLQTASIIEGGVLAGAYQIHDSHKYWASVLLVVGALLLFGVLLIINRDIQHADIIRESKDADPCIPKPPEGLSIFDFCRTCEIPDNDLRRIGGRHVTIAMILILILLNTLAALRFSGIWMCLCPN